MKYHYDLSILATGVRTENWTSIFDQCKDAVGGGFSYELIFTGPYPLPERLQKEKHVKYIKSFASPTKSLHMATRLVESPIFTWVVDDSQLPPDGIGLALNLLLSNNPKRDIVAMRYNEGVNFTGNFPLDYWRTGYHADLRQPGIDPNLNFGTVLMLSMECYDYFVMDCRFEHVNMNYIDLCIRAIKSGESKILLSPIPVMNLDFEPGRDHNNSPVIAAYVYNDRDLFYDIYKDNLREIRLDPENWREADVVWKRRKFD